jgi:YVTN family beta-propeller protein
VSVINTATNTVTATIPVGSNPTGVAVTQNRSKVYVANQGSNTVSVIKTKDNKVIATIPVGSSPFGVAVIPGGSKVYVTKKSGKDSGKKHTDRRITSRLAIMKTAGAVPMAPAFGRD